MEEGRIVEYFKMKETMQSHFQYKVLQEPISIIKPGGIFAIKIKDNSRARARLLSANQEKSCLLVGDLGELTEAENEDLHQLSEETRWWLE